MKNKICILFNFSNIRLGLRHSIATRIVLVIYEFVKCATRSSFLDPIRTQWTSNPWPDMAGNL